VSRTGEYPEPNSSNIFLLGTLNGATSTHWRRTHSLASGPRLQAANRHPRLVAGSSEGAPSLSPARATPRRRCSVSHTSTQQTWLMLCSPKASHEPRVFIGLANPHSQRNSCYRRVFSSRRCLLTTATLSRWRFVCQTTLKTPDLQ
jgi:hypothetical protein